MKQFYTFLLLALLFSSCAKVYYSPDANTLATHHRTIAIIPPSVFNEEYKNDEAESIALSLEEDSRNIQMEIYEYLLKRKSKGKFCIAIQAIETTNLKLSKASYPTNKPTSAELCALLGVEAVLYANFELMKPFPEGIAILARLFGIRLPTNKVYVTLDLKDCAYDKIIWNYSHKKSGTTGSTATNLVRKLIKDASKKMPYAP